MRRDNQDSDGQDGRQATDTVSGQFKDNADRQGPALPDSQSDEGQTLPLLEEVIEPGDPSMMGSDKAGPRNQQAPLSIVQSPSQRSREFERDILEYELRTQLFDGLEQIVSTALSEAVEEAVRDLQRSLNDVLIESIESRLDENVTVFLDSQFLKK